MPRLVKKIPSYRHHRPSGRALVCLSGKRIYLGKWDTSESRERYRQVIAEWLADGKLPGDDQSLQDLRIVELLAEYWTHAEARGSAIGSGDRYEAYKAFCRRASQKPLTGRASAGLVAELDLYAFIRTQVESRGRYGRRRKISLAIDDELCAKVYRTIQINFGIQRRLPDWAHS